MDLVLATAVLFVIAAIAPLVVRLGRAAPFILAAAPAALTGYFMTKIDVIERGDTVSVAYEWVAALGVDYALRIDGLSLIFALLICGIGALIVLYAGSYMKGHPELGRFYLILFLFMGAMLGLVLADNLLTLFVFWELTSISSYGLISFESQRTSARASAAQALYVTGGGGLALLAGLVLMGIETGSTSMSEILAGGSLEGAGLYYPILILVFIGAFTKSAQAPFHFWLPNAMEAPTPVSAYLHSATMVKAGVYLLARFSPALGGTDAWFYTVSIVGAVTMVLGAFLALREHDLKRILAYSTLSILGSLVFLIGIGGEEATLAALVLLMAHAFYKAALFLCAGNIDHGAGTRDLRQLGGLRRYMPVTAACVGLAGFSMIGLPPFMGFLAKESVYEALQHGERLAVAAVVVAFTVNTLMVGVALLLIIRPFLGREPHYHHHPHEGDGLLLAGPVVLAITGTLIGIVPGLVDTALIGTAASQVLAEPVDFYLRLWHGVNTTLLLSIITVLAGVGVYLVRDRYIAPGVEAALRTGVSAEAVYDRGLDGLQNLAYKQARVFQSGYLGRYLWMTMSFAVVMILGTALIKADLTMPEWAISPTIGEIAVVGIALAGVLIAVTTQSRFTAIIALGFVGYGIALIFALFGAPDLAITQVLIETLIVLLMVFAFYRLPRFMNYSRVGSRLLDGALATAVGVTITALLLTSLSIERSFDISTTMAQTSKPEAYGSNVVNVILVDFRSLDTLGEIAVLAIAAIGIISLLKFATTPRSDE